MEKIPNNSKELSKTLFVAISDVLSGKLEPKIADVAFNGAGKWINNLRLKLEYRTYKGTISKIDELEE